MECVGCHGVPYSSRIDCDQMSGQKVFHSGVRPDWNGMCQIRVGSDVEGTCNAAPGSCCAGHDFYGGLCIGDGTGTAQSTVKERGAAVRKESRGGQL